MKKEDKLFFLGLFFLTLTLFLFPLCVYLYPKAWFGWEYALPDLIVEFIIQLQVWFNVSYLIAFRALIRVIFLSSLVFGLVAYVIAQKLSLMGQGKEGDEESDSEAMPNFIQNSRESVAFILKMMLVIALVFVGANVIQWTISSSPPVT